MTNQVQNQNKTAKYDLEERTALFGENITDLVKQIHLTPVTTSLVSQSVRAATSIGANYMEADAADSKKDFRFKISLCKKESKETLHWLRMLSKAVSVVSDRCRELWKEAHELVLIFSSILKK